MNYYKAVEKKPEHGGGWAFMQLNRREGAAIYCGCTWETPGHATKEEAERCFYDKEMGQPARWSTQAQASPCAICGVWTPRLLQGGGNLLDLYESVCHGHFENDDDAAAWLRERHPFAPGIEITASW
jgi:hypothetical protein